MPLRHPSFACRATALPALFGLALLLTACGGGGSEGAAVPPVATQPPPTGADPDGPAPQPDPPTVPLATCGALAGTVIAPARIGLPTQGATITSATAVGAGDAGNTLGDYCRVRGTIAPIDAQAPVIQFAT